MNADSQEEKDGGAAETGNQGAERQWRGRGGEEGGARLMAHKTTCAVNIRVVVRVCV